MVSSSDKTLKAIQLGEDLLEWVVTALKSSHADEKRHHNEMVSKFQHDYNKLQRRLDSMYIDKLDGIITQEIYDQKSVDWRRDQAEILQKIKIHQNANESYIEEGIKILELANKAYDLYIHQPADSTRTLLNYVYSNSIWKDQKLVLTYQKPFDLLVEANKKQVEMTELVGGKIDKKSQNEIWLTN